MGCDPQVIVARKKREALARSEAAEIKADKEGVKANVVVEPKVEGDLNNDGVVDKTDASMAGKTLNIYKKRGRPKKIA